MHKDVVRPPGPPDSSGGSGGFFRAALFRFCCFQVKENSRILHKVYDW